MALRRGTRQPEDPWRDAPVGELSEQLLPRWFAIAIVALVPLAVLVLAAAFLAFRPRDIPVAERRPPPAEGLTVAVGQLAVGEAEPESYGGDCPHLQDAQTAGTETDRAHLEQGLDALCEVADANTTQRLARFADVGGVVRFAVFEATGVDVTADLDGDPPAILINARFSQTDARWIAPLVASQLVFLDADPSMAEAALQSRAAELATCDALLPQARRSRACTDAAELLQLDDPVVALRQAGFR